MLFVSRQTYDPSAPILHILERLTRLDRGGSSTTPQAPSIVFHPLTAAPIRRTRIPSRPSFPAAFLPKSQIAEGPRSPRCNVSCEHKPPRFASMLAGSASPSPEFCDIVLRPGQTDEED